MLNQKVSMLPFLQMVHLINRLIIDMSHQYWLFRKVDNTISARLSCQQTNENDQDEK